MLFTRKLLVAELKKFSTIFLYSFVIEFILWKSKREKEMGTAFRDLLPCALQIHENVFIAIL